MHPKVQMIEQMTIANMQEVRKTKDGDNARAIPDFGPGDTLTVAVRVVEGEKERIQNFTGICIARRGGGSNATFRVRKISNGVGVERIFLETSPKVAKVEVVQEGKVRRAKLYYLRGLEGKAARVEREVETLAASAASASARAAKSTSAK